MNRLTRFGISIEDDLLTKFDGMIKKRGYINRSEAIRDLIRERIVIEKTEDLEGDVIGVVSLVYNHNQLALPSKLTHAQHKNYSSIISSLHIHLDEYNCLEVLIMKGKSKNIRNFADSLISRKGVIHGNLTMTTINI